MNSHVHDRHHHFDFNLNARSFFPLFIAFFIPWLIIEGFIVFRSWRAEMMLVESPASVFGLLLPIAALFLLTVLFYIPILRKLISAASFDNQAYHFRGSIGRFFGLNLLGLFLTIITLGIYGPWYITRICRYLVGEISYKEQPLEFTGRGGRLFAIILLTILLPMIPMVLLQTRLDPIAFGSPLNPFQHFLLQVLVQLLFWSFFAAYLYTVYRWFFTHLRYSGLSLSWNCQFWSSVALIWVQGLLCVVTLGIYLPAAYIKIYRYFVEHTEIQDEGKPVSRLDFNGRTGGGFGLLWAQLLLSVITLGIYSPWALAKVGKWFLSQTYLEPI